MPARRQTLFNVPTDRFAFFPAALVKAEVHTQTLSFPATLSVSRAVGLATFALVLSLGALPTTLLAQEAAGALLSTCILQGTPQPSAAVLLLGSEIPQPQCSAGLMPAAFEVIGRQGDGRDSPTLQTQIPPQKTTIQVVATPKEVAQAQVQEQEKQRILGFVPDYYTSYLWNASPMTPKLKFKLAIRDITDPISLLFAAGLAGVEQQHNTFPGYGQGAEGYAKRFGAAYADTVANRMMSRAIFPTLLHQDPRYFYRGSGSIGSRIFYALAQAVVCRGDDGRLEPNYSQILGNFSAAALSNVYRAPGDRSVGLTVRDGLIIMGIGAAENVFRELASKKLTPHVPSFANGKP